MKYNFKKFFFPLVLSLLPILLLIPSINEEQNEINKLIEQEIIQISDSAISKIRDASTLKYWVYKSTKDLKIRCELEINQFLKYKKNTNTNTNISQNINNVTPKNLCSNNINFLVKKTLEKNYSKLIRLGIFKSVKIWCFYIFNHDKQAQNFDINLIEANNFEKEYKKIFTKLFKLLVLNHYYNISIGNSIGLQAIFGNGFTSELLESKIINVPIPVIYKQNYYYFTWNIIEIEKEPIAGFITLIENNQHQKNVPLEALFKFWHKIIPKYAISAAFFLYPGPKIDYLPNYIIHKNLRDKKIIKNLVSLTKQFKWQKAKYDLSHIKNQNESNISIKHNFSEINEIYNKKTNTNEIITVKDCIATFSIPYNIIDSIIKFDKYYFRIFALSENNPYYGVLCLNYSSKYPNQIKKVFIALIIAWVLGWLINFILVLSYQESYRITSGIQITAWLLCLMAYPGILLFSSQHNLIMNLQISSIEETVVKLKKRLLSLESIFNKQIQKKADIINNILASKSIVNILTQAKLANNNDSNVLALLLKKFFEKGIQPEMVAVVGSNSYLLATHTKELSLEQINFIKKSILEVGTIFINHNPAEPLPLTTNYFYSSVFSSDLNSDYRSPGTVKIATIGTKRLCRLHNFIYDNSNKILLYVVVIWQPDKTFPEQLKHILRRLHAKHGIETAVFYKSNFETKLLAGSGRVTSFYNQVKASIQRPYYFIEPNQEFIQYIYPSNVLKNYIFCTKDTISSAKKKIEKEKFWFLWISLSGLAFILIFSGQSIYFWLGITVKELNLAIKELGKGNFSVRVKLASNDEFGIAAKAIENMASNLEQKRIISYFIADKVVDEIQSEIRNKSFENKIKERIILFTDIRNFTSHSESNPPEIIFQTLNRHFKEITESIKMYGGQIERFLGDAVQAFFDISNQQSKEITVIKALLAAIEIYNRWQRLQNERKNSNLFRYNIGIGISIGNTISGIIGDPNLRQDLLIFGEPILSASLMESLSKNLNRTSIVVSDQIKDIANKYFIFEKISDDPKAWELLPTIKFNSNLYSLIDAINIHTNIKEKNIENFSSNKIHYFSKTGNKAFKVSILAFWAISTLLMNLSINSWNKTIEYTNLVLNNLEINQILDEAKECYNPYNQTALLFNKHFELIESQINKQIHLGKLNINKDYNKILKFYHKHLSKLSKRIDGIIYYIVKAGNLYYPKNLDLAQMILNDLYNKTLAKFDNLPKNYHDFIQQINIKKPKKYLDSNFYSKQILYTNKTTTSPINDWMLISLIWNFEKHLMKKENFIEIGLSEALLSALLNKKEPFQFRSIYASSLNSFSKLVIPDYRYTFYWHPVCLYSNNSKINCVFHIIVLIPQNYFTFENALKNTEFKFALDKTLVKFTKLIKDQKEIHYNKKLKRNIKYFDINSNKNPTEKNYKPNKSIIYLSKSIVVGQTVVNVEIAKKVKKYISTPKLLKVFKAIFIVWLVMGIVFIVLHVFRKKVLDLLDSTYNLRHKLIFAFFIFLLPTVIVTICFLQRNLLIELLASKFKQESFLEEELRKAETSYDILQNWRSRIAIAILEKFIHKIIKMNQYKFIANKNHHYKINIQNLEKIYYKFLKYGLIPVGLVIDGSVISNSSLSLIDIDVKEDPNILLAKLVLPTLYQINPDNKSTNNTLTLANSSSELISEEILNVTKYILPPDLLTEMLNLAWIDTKMEVGNTILQIFKAFIPITSNKPLVLNIIIWDYRWIVTVLADIWKNTKHHMYYKYQIFLPSLPFVTVPYPYLHINTYNMQTKDGKVFCIKFGEYITPQNTAISSLLHLADSSKQAISRVTYDKSNLDAQFDDNNNYKNNSYFEDENLILGYVRTSSIASRFYFYLSLPLGKIWNKQIRATRIKVLFVSLIVFFSMILGTFISLRFTKPLESFCNACIKVQNGIYKQKLEFKLGNELDELASSFNKLCKDLEEGKLIKTFVSDSLKTVVKNQDLIEQAKKGEIKDATIMFIGIEDIISPSSNDSISKSFDMLNKILVDLSFIIKKYNGDIDKFIGSKMLALFDHKAFNSTEEVMINAVRASLDLFKLLQNLKLDYSIKYGIGLVSGRVLAGILGSELVRLEYTVLGDTVNLASRLCDLALKNHYNSILLDSITATHVNKVFNSIPLGETKIKGKLREVMVYKIIVT